MRSLLDLSTRTAGGVLRRVSRLGRIAEPRSWAAADWGGDVIPQLALGMLAAVVAESLTAPAQRGSAILRR